MVGEWAAPLEKGVVGWSFAFQHRLGDAARSVGAHRGRVGDPTVAPAASLHLCALAPRRGGSYASAADAPDDRFP